MQAAPMAMMPAASPLGRTPLKSEQDLDARLESLRTQLRQASKRGSLGEEWRECIKLCD
jgi:hypothetical protein